MLLFLRINIPESKCYIFMENTWMIKTLLATGDTRVAEKITRAVQNCCQQVMLVESTEEVTERDS